VHGRAGRGGPELYGFGDGLHRQNNDIFMSIRAAARECWVLLGAATLSPCVPVMYKPHDAWSVKSSRATERALDTPYPGYVAGRRDGLSLPDVFLSRVPTRPGAAFDHASHLTLESQARETQPAQSWSAQRVSTSGSHNRKESSSMGMQRHAVRSVAAARTSPQMEAAEAGRETTARGRHAHTWHWARQLARGTCSAAAARVRSLTRWRRLVPRSVLGLR